MKKNILYLALISFSLFSCDEYLDIVPDQTQELDLLLIGKNQHTQHL